MDSIDSNKQLVARAFGGLAEGNGAPLRDSLADDIAWTLIGTTAWSRTYRGKPAVLGELLAPVLARFADRYTATIHRIIAEADVVVVELRGRAVTKEGQRYDNAYCFVCRVADGRLVEITEYLDTALVNAVL